MLVVIAGVVVDVSRVPRSIRQPLDPVMGVSNSSPALDAAIDGRPFVTNFRFGRRDRGRCVVGAGLDRGKDVTGSELPEGDWLAGREGSSIQWSWTPSPSSHECGASDMVNSLNSCSIGGLVLGVVKLTHWTTYPARGLFEGPGLIERKGVPQ